jgi:hypothetical protein
MGKPNFFIVGAAKAGTSTLAEYISKHPDVFMSRFKEPAYFLGPPPANHVSRRFRGPIHSDKYRTSLAEYLRLFDEVRHETIVGEASVNYSQLPHFPGVAERIHQFNPDSRFVYLLRDPIERAISHYWFNVQNEDEMRDIETALIDDPYYTDVNYYRMQLEPYLQLFGMERIYVMTAEALSSNPLGEVQMLFRWLGIDDSIAPDNIDLRFNTTPGTITQLKTNGFLHRFRYSGAWELIQRIIPPPISRTARRLVEKEIDRSEVDISRVVEQLRPRSIRRVTELSQLLGREFTEWKTVFDTSHDRQCLASAPIPDATGNARGSS